tara:strand:- start:2930 stop:3328 length:399 start_codon:yes stop_codon:yes gene_type:complete
MKKGPILLGILFILGIISSIGVSALFFSGWGLYPAYGATYYNYPYYGGYGYGYPYYGGYGMGYGYSLANNYVQNSNFDSFTKNTLQNTYNFAGSVPNQYGFPSNSQDFNYQSPYGFQENTQPYSIGYNSFSY